VPDEGIIFALARDVTEHKRLQALAARQAADLARSNAELEQFASIASHDLQAPLRAVRHLADWIEEELGENVPESVARHLQSLRDRVDLMSSLVGDLLAYSRVGREAEKIEPTDTASLVAAVAELLGPPEGFEIVASPDLPVLQTTRPALEQVLRNLITNAVTHHDRSTGTVSVSARDVGRFWQFDVTDDGPGIPIADRDKVFEMLWSHRADGHRGTGMGLALVKRIVERVGGRVWLEQVDGRGAMFCFTWPKRLTP